MHLNWLLQYNCDVAISCDDRNKFAFVSELLFFLTEEPVMESAEVLTSCVAAHNTIFIIYLNLNNDKYFIRY